MIACTEPYILQDITNNILLLEEIVALKYRHDSTVKNAEFIIKISILSIGYIIIVLRKCRYAWRKG